MKNRRRRRKRKIGRRILLLLLGMGLLSFSGNQAYHWVNRTPFFALKEVDIQGNFVLPEGFLLEQSGVTLGLNLFQIDGKKVKEQLLQIPRVKWVEVRRQWPGTLRLLVKEKNSIGSLNGSYEVGEDGELFQVRGRRDLPSIVGENPEGIKEGVILLSFLAGTEGLSQIESLEESGVRPMGRSSEEVFPMDRMDVTNPDDILLYLTPHRLVHMGRGNYEEKVNRLKLLLEEFQRRGEVYRSIDLRFKDQAIVKK
ncbi:FtsQ-type POTRA domain-containing protein [candidate division TA06 bacterium]|nr:FtsQ-type POTRA domain-containing protein [candidate division TA06 bacterium]